MTASSLSLEGAPFQSPWWLPERHSQTLWRRFYHHRRIRQRRQRIELDDGDFIDVDWVDADIGSGSADNPIILLLHGLSGCSGSPYIQSLQRLLQNRGFTSAAMNFRGCSGEINRLARAYHSGCTEDVEAVYCAIRRISAAKPLAFVGFSLGGNVLLKWLSEVGPAEPIVAGVAISTPFSLACCAEVLSTGAGSLYGQYFRRRLVRDLEAKRAYFRHSARHPGWQTELEKLEALGDLRRLKSLWDFDDQVTAPLHGFAGAADYYARCSSANVLGSIQVPVCLIQSGNDPIVPSHVLPAADALPSAVSLQLSAEGGHVGFTCAGNPLWLEERVLAAIESSLRC
jgi:predicted alpha/beta-fold hydrolase